MITVCSMSLFPGLVGQETSSVFHSCFSLLLLEGLSFAVVLMQQQPEPVNLSSQLLCLLSRVRVRRMLEV